MPLERLLRAGTDLPLYIDNGANAMGLAEQWFGAGQGARHAVVCLIGSGIGASIIGYGAAERAGGSSGTEWGHTTIMVGGRDCRCGSLGHLEAYVGAGAILERYGLPLPGRRRGVGAGGAGSDLAETSPEAAKVLDGDRTVPGRRDRQPDQLVQPRPDHPGRLGRPAARPPHAAGHPVVGARARAEPPVRQTTITVGRLGPDAVALGAATLPIRAFLNGSAVPAARRTAASEEIRPTGTGHVG